MADNTQLPMLQDDPIAMLLRSLVKPGTALPGMASSINTGGYLNIPPAAAPPVPGQPTMGGGVTPPKLPQPTIMSHSLPNTGFTFPLGTMPQMPQPPTIQAPGVPTIPGYDFAEYKKLLDKAGVTGSENMANVLGGLASGAASVSAAEPGSFAKALAAAGAGGMQGYRATTQTAREDAQRRAAAELQMQSLQHQSQVQAADLAYKGAELRYKADVQNKLLTYEQGMKKFELEMPQIQHDANGVTIRQIDPASGQMTATYHPTKTVLDKVESMGNLIKAFGKDSAVGQATEMQMLMDTYKGNPQLAQGALVQLALRQVIAAGGGQSVFGTAYEKAAKDASKQLNLENPTLQTKPAEYQQELQNRVIATLLSDPRVNSLGWLNQGATHSVAARVIWESLGGGSAEQPQQ